MMPERSETGARGKRRSIVRTVTVGGKFTEAEAKTLAKQAAQRGQLLGEWARESLLAASREQTREVEDTALFSRSAGPSPGSHQRFGTSAAWRTR